MGEKKDPVLLAHAFDNEDTIMVFDNGIVGYVYNYENGDTECVNVNLRAAAEAAILERNEWASLPHRQKKND